MKSLYEKCHGKKHLYVVWHDVWSSKGFARKMLGTVETKDETRTRVRIIGLFSPREKTPRGKIPTVEGGRNNVSLTLAEAESTIVVMSAMGQKRFVA